MPVADWSTDDVAAHFLSKPFLKKYAAIIQDSGITGVDLQGLVQPEEVAEFFDIQGKIAANRVAQSIGELVNNSSSSSRSQPKLQDQQVQQRKVPGPAKGASTGADLPVGKEYAAFISHKKVSGVVVCICSYPPFCCMSS